MAIEIMAVREKGGPRVPCLKCTQCCRYATIQVDEPGSASAASHLLWMSFHGILLEAAGDGTDWWALVPTRCSELQDDGRCRSYHYRPDICRKYDAKTCEVNDTGANVDTVLLTDPERLVGFLFKTRPKVVWQMIRKGYLDRELAGKATGGKVGASG